MSKKNHIDCDNCGTLTETKSKTVQIPRFGQKLNFKINDAEVCPKCSKTYIPSKSAKKIDQKLKKLALA